VVAVWIRLAAELRSCWRGWLILAALGGFSGGAVIATAAAARRTDSAIPRYQAAVETADVWVGRGPLWGLEIDYSRVRRLPQVAHSRRSLDLAFWGRTSAGRPLTVNDVELNAPIDGADGAKKHPRLLAGRSPDPTRVDEISVGSMTADRFGLGLGSTLRARFTTPRELARLIGTGGHDARANPETAGKGLLLTLRVVGVRAEVVSEDALGWISMSPAFYDAYAPRLSAWVEFLGVWLKGGDADLEAFRAGVERVRGRGLVGFYPDRTYVAKLQSSIHLQAQALWALVALGGLVWLMLVGQALARQIALESGEHPVLRSLGMTASGLVALGLLRVVPVAVVAGIVAAGVAFALSPLAPIGAALTAEPDPGFAADPVIWAGGAAIVVLFLITAVVPVWLASRMPGEEGRPQSARLVGLLARGGLSPSAVIGIRMALESGRGRTAVPARSTLLGAVVGVAAVGATLTLAASADHLLSTPTLYGQNWDVTVGSGADPGYPDRFVARLRAHPSIARLSAGTATEARVSGRPVGVLAMDALRGSLGLTVLEGRAPKRSGEILLGSTTADEIDAMLGDTVQGRIGGRSLSFRVVGRGVLPDLGVTSANTLALGDGVAVTFQAARRLDPLALRNIFLVGLARGADRRAAFGRLRREASVSLPKRPAEVGNWGGVSGFPYALAGLVAGTMAAILAHALATSIRRRRRDLAILKTLGFERRHVRAALAWHATTVVAVGLLVGLPLGLAAGRFAWTLFAVELGVVPVTVVPVSSALAIVAASILLANVVALPLGRFAARIRPAVALRAE
jgi:hypothetical protein